MKISLALLILLIPISSLFSQEKEIKVNSIIKEVTVYLSGARIKRTASVNLKAGKNELILSKLSTVIDESSIQVAGLKNANVLSVNYEIDYLEKKLISEQVNQLKAKKTLLELQKNKIKNKLTAYSKELKVLDYNLRVNSDQTDLSLEKLKQIGAFHREQTNFILDKQYELQTQQDKITIEINNLIKEIKKQQGDSKEEQGEIKIKLDAPTATSITLVINYNVTKSGWYPEYDLKSNNIQTDLNIVYKANMYQETGVSWDNVGITLSTGDPTLDNNKPNLESKYLRFVYGNYRKKQVSTLKSNYKYNPTVGTVSGIVTGDGLPLPGVNISIPGTSLGAVSDFDGNYTIKLPNGSRNLVFSSIGFESENIPVYASRINMDLKEDVEALEEVVVIGYSSKRGSSGKLLANKNKFKARAETKVLDSEDQSYNQTVDAKEEGITNTSFKIKNKFTIKSNSESTAIEIDKFTLPTKYSYYVAPELNNNVFLTATLSNWEQFDLLTGEANIYFEGNYVGKALIEPNSTKEKLVLSLGIDPNIVVDRKEPKNFKSKSFTGGTRIVKKAFEISIKNNKSQPIDLIIEERIPISNNKEIKVDAVVTEGAEYNAKTGIVKWNAKIPSKQSVKKEFSYTVKYPKGKRVNL